MEEEPPRGPADDPPDAAERPTEASPADPPAPTMRPVVADVVVGCPAAEVLAFLADPIRGPEWLRGVRTCSWLTEPAGGAGRYVQEARYLGRPIRTTFALSVDEAAGVVVLVAEEGTPFPVTVTRQVEALDGDRARVTETVEAAPGGLYRLVAPLLRAMVARTVRRDQARLRRRLEADPSAEEPALRPEDPAPPETAGPAPAEEAAPGG